MMISIQMEDAQGAVVYVRSLRITNAEIVPANVKKRRRPEIVMTTKGETVQFDDNYTQQLKKWQRKQQTHECRSRSHSYL